ncbi:MAG: hypothetical protein ACI9E1_001703 [Cryomorphaceae bacterium]|jgi:hypothetical protein
MESFSHSSKHPLIDKLAKLFCLLAAVGLLNVHIALYQGYAWVTMLNDRIPEQGIENAISTTFSGDHPCDKCIAVAEQRVNEQQQEPLPELKPSSKVPLICSVFTKLNLRPVVGKRLAFVLLENLPLVGISLPVFGPPPQFV